ncbi:MAG: DUF6868 family protein [Venatoribacter sp.]
MFTIAQLTEFLGWASILNLGYLLLATLMVVGFKRPVMSVHKLFFKLDDASMELKYFEFLSHYKVATFVLTVIPYLALKIMA